MGILGNILWFIFGGFAAGLSWVIAGIGWCITIIGIPIGFQCFKFAGLAFFPFGKQVAYGGDESYREYILAAFDGDSDGDCRCSLGMYPVHYDYWYSIRKAIFQAREIVADAIWGNGCIGRGNRSCKYL